ncbi:MAG: ATP-binding protein, partial [Bacteroidia bacterium]
ITSDAKGYIWLGTRYGLNRIQQNEKTISRFYEHNGLVSNVFNQGFAHNFNNKLLFGTRRGALFFNATEIDMNRLAPKVVLTKAKIAGKEYKNPFAAIDLESLEIDYFDYGFTLEFAAIDFNSADKVHYEYKMDGLGDEWVQLLNSNDVTFSNLPEGDYTLLVRAISSSGNLSDNEIKLSIKIKPPFYSAIWFRFTMVALVVIAGVSIYVYRINREKTRSRILAQEVDKRTKILKDQNEELELAKEKALASDKAKSEFMATMSHEIRTPMNGILGSVGLLEQGTIDQEQKEQLSLITECGDNMLAIINEILDYSKIESGKMQAVISQFDIVESIQNTVESHASRAHGKGLELTCYIAPNVPRLIESDKNRISQILNNLLSNAVKFTKKGNVHCEVELANNSNDSRLPLKITVTDTGIGIPAEKQAEIWDAFSQVDNSSTREFGGTGLGLAIVRSMTQLLGGYFTLNSEWNTGSSFTIEIPVEGEVRKPKGYNLPKKQLLIASSGAQTNKIIERYAVEFGFETRVINGLNELGAINDDVKYDALFVDSLTMTYEFYGAWKQMAKQTFLIVPVEDKLNLNLEEGINGVITKPTWRSKFQSLFINKIQHSSTKKSAQIDNPDAYKNVRILLAEDNKVNQIVTKKIITKLGLNLDIAVDGQDAINKFKANQYDLILMDLLMPDVDGTQATKSIRELHEFKQPYIVAFSANIFNKDLTYFKAQGFNNVLSKPAKVDEMATLLNNVVKNLNI